MASVFREHLGEDLALPEFLDDFLNKLHRLLLFMLALSGLDRGTEG